MRTSATLRSIIGSFLLFCSIASSAHANRLGVDLDSYLGNYRFSKERTFEGSAVHDRPGASIEKEKIYVAPLKETFVRYVFWAHSPRRSSSDPAVFTLYQSESGKFFSLVWDQGSLSSENSFSDPAFLNHLFEPGVSWVEFEPIGTNELRGVFNAGDRFGEEKVSIVFNKNSVVITTRMIDPALGFIPVPVREVETFTRD